jgi:hypothetical protein
VLVVQRGTQAQAGLAQLRQRPGPGATIPTGSWATAQQRILHGETAVGGRPVAQLPAAVAAAGKAASIAHSAAQQATAVMDRNLQENARERGEDRNQPGPAAEPAATTPSPPTVPCGPSQARR